MNINFFKNRIFQLFLLLAVALVFLNFINVSQKSAKSSTNQATLMLYLDDNTQRKFIGDVSDNMTMLQAVYSSSLGGKFDFRYTMGKIGEVKVYSIDGKNENTGNNWHFFLNGQSVKTDDLNKVIIRKGDTIEAKFK